MNTDVRDRPSHNRPSRNHPSLGSDVLASLAVACFSLAVAAGLARVFSGWSFMYDMALVVVAGHGSSLLLRRFRLTGWIAVPAVAAVLAWVVLALYYADTFSWALPTSDTWALLQRQLSEVRADFATAVAPVAFSGGWDVLATIGVALAVLLADLFAFRADARAETLVPGGVLFVFVGALGDERLQIATAVVLVAAGVITTAVLRSYHAAGGPEAGVTGLSWRSGPAVLAVGVIVALAAGFVGPRLPGADAAPLYDTGGRGGRVTEVVSPLVDIRSRLTNRSTDELFSVAADVESYWRSATLPEFDGTTWGLPERSLRPVDESLATPRDATIENRQQITIGALVGTLVPAAPDPFRASGPDDLRWVAETSTLVTVDGDLEAGDVIDVVSATLQLDEATLRSATSDDPGDDIYTSVPSDLPPVVAETARRVTSGSRTPYEAARMLQEFFQRDFTYSLEVQPGHDGSAIESFLRDRVGYCEQFAGTYAAMMRSLGIPARVAVGFTSGVAASEGVWSVLGRNAHAWPEVWFDDIGWVAFEPTPGRGAPNAEAYTGLAPDQDLSGADSVLADQDDAPPPTMAPVAPAQDQFDVDLPEEFVEPSRTADEPGPTAGSSGSGAPWRWLLGGALVALIAGAPALVRSLRPKVASLSVDHQLARAWERAIDAVRLAGVPLRPSDTPIEVARRTAHHFPVVARPMASLADAVTAATYRADGSAGYDEVGAYGASPAGDCRNWAKQIDRAVTESLGWPDRVRRYFTTWS
jgi:transglutaminase-like putative cysteine protease